MRRCVANIIYIGAALAAFLTLITTVFTRQILEALDTQPEMMQDAYDYLVWVFAGLGALMMYNLLAGILRSLGDSRTPLVFLIISSLLNIVLDILLVKTFAIGVKGASIATVIAQLVSGVGCLWFIKKKFPILHLTKEDLKPHWPTIRRLVCIGIPMGLQFSITAVGSLILQRSVNGLEAAAVASVSAAGKVQALIVSPMDAFGVTTATFVGQNYGAGKFDRMRKGVLQVGMMLMAWSVIGFTINVLYADRIALLFIDSSETLILSQVKRFMFWNGLFYPILTIIFVTRNALQGAGFSNSAMLGGVFELVARVVVGIFAVPALGFFAVCLANPVAWTMADMILVPLYIVLMRKLKGPKTENA